MNEDITNNDNSEINGNNLEKLTVTDVTKAMQHFYWPDYVVLISIGLLYIVVGFYYYFKKSSGSAQDYLVGGRSMSVFPIAVSLVATHLSGIAMLGIPTEIYVFGTQYIFLTLGLILMAVLFQQFYLPVFYNMKITSIYEYLERRFDRKVRLLGSILFILSTLVWLPIVIYVPALAFNLVTGLNMSVILAVSTIICVFYTTTGGLRAVVWTDVAQASFMALALFLIAMKGTIDVGGLKVVYERNWEGSRFEKPNFDVNPLTRHTVWSLFIGGSIYWIQACGLSQNMIQRYVAVPTFKDSKRALWYFILGLFIIEGLCIYCGLLIYATYYDCDPVTTTLVKQRDQLLILMVMDVIGNYPGLTGLFLTGVFGASLSSLSTGLNSMAAVFLEDFYKSFFKRELTDVKTNIFLKSSVVLLGGVCLGFSYIVGLLSTTVLQLNASVVSISTGPLLALFTMGIFLPWIDAAGAFYSGIFGLITMAWLCVNAQMAIAAGNVIFETKPIRTDGCFYNFTPTTAPIQPASSNYVFPLFRISYRFYSLFGALVTIVIALLISFLVNKWKTDNVDDQLLVPFVRRFVKKQKPKLEETELSVSKKLINNQKKEYTIEN